MSSRPTSPPHPTQSGTYAILRAVTGETPALNGTVTFPTGSNFYHNADSAVQGGEVTVAVIEQDTDGAYLLAAPADYEWYLSACPDKASVRLVADITLEAKEYSVKANFPRPSAFDGAGHTLTLPEGATLSTTGNATLVAPYPSGANPTVRNLRVRLLGAITTTGSNAGAVVGFSDTSLTLENVAVEVAGKIASTGSVGGVIGGVWGPKISVTVRQVRADLASTVQLSGADAYRGVGGCIGAFRAPGSLSETLVMAEAGATLQGAAGRGLLIGYFQTKDGTPTVESCAAVDFGAAASGLKACAVGTPTLFCAKDSTLAQTEGAVLVETGTFSARDGATVALLQGAAEERLILPEATPADAVWAMAKAEGLNTVTVSPTDSPELNPGATRPLFYAFRAMDTLPEGLLCDATVSAACTPTMRAADGAYLLASEPDYAWYLANCPNGATVRMVEDITLAEKEYIAWVSKVNGSELVFDGQGHTLTLPTGATMKGKGSATGWDYGGVVAGQLLKGEIRDVTVVVGGKVTAKPYAGAVLGSTVYNGGSNTVSLANVRVHLREGGEIAAIQNGNNARAGGIIGFNYHSPAILTDCAILLDKGSKLTSTNAAAQAASQTAAVCGSLSEDGREQGVTVIDLGVEMPEGAAYSHDTKGNIALYKASDLATNYGTAVASTPQETLLQGEQEGVAEDGLLTLVTGEAPVVAAGSAKAADGWRLTQEGNAVKVTEGPGGVCALTYGLEGFPGVAIPVRFTPMVLAELPEGITATLTQRTLLMEAAAKAALPLPAKVAFREGMKSKTLDALEVFAGILRADNAAGTLVVDYDFGVSKMVPMQEAEEDAPRMSVTARVSNEAGTATFAEGAQVDLVRTTEDASPLAAPIIPSAATSEVTFTFPLEKNVELFRARVVKAGKQPAFPFISTPRPAHSFPPAETFPHRPQTEPCRG